MYVLFIYCEMKTKPLRRAESGIMGVLGMISDLTNDNVLYHIHIPYFSCFPVMTYC